MAPTSQCDCCEITFGLELNTVRDLVVYTLYNVISHDMYSRSICVGNDVISRELCARFFLCAVALFVCVNCCVKYSVPEVCGEEIDLTIRYPTTVLFTCLQAMTEECLLNEKQ